VRSWGLSAAEQDEVWRRWREEGQSLQLIARRLGKRGPSVRAFVLQTRGVQRQPPRGNARWLTMAEREEISRGVAAGQSCRQIAARLERAPSTVSRELARNGGRGCYRPRPRDPGRYQRPRRRSRAARTPGSTVPAAASAWLGGRRLPRPVPGLGVSEVQGRLRGGGACRWWTTAALAAARSGAAGGAAVRGRAAKVGGGAVICMAGSPSPPQPGL